MVVLANLKERLELAIAPTTAARGNLQVLGGKPTDESGFGGASFASGELGEGEQRGAVQLPDPFLERVLNVAVDIARAACGLGMERQGAEGDLHGHFDGTGRPQPVMRRSMTSICSSASGMAARTPPR